MDPNAPAPSDDELAEAVAALIIRAGSSHLDDRRRAIEQLYELACRDGPRMAEAVTVLADALRDPDPKVGESASWALRYCKPHSIEPLVCCLAHGLPRVRERAAQSLGNIGNEAVSALPALRARLADEDQAVRCRAAWAIGLIGDTHPDAVELLMGKVAHGSTEDQAAALHALGNIGKALDEPGRLRAHQPRILAALRHDDASVRWSALYVVESLGLAPQAHAGWLAEIVRHEQAARVADAALSQLRKLAPVVDLTAVVPSLIARLAGPAPQVRLACEVLSSVRPPPLEATAPLLRLLGVDELVLPAAGALWRLTGQAEPLLPALDRVFGEQGESVCDLVCELGPAAAPLLPRLIDALAQDDWDLQWAAADALGAVASEAVTEPRVLDALIEALQHPSPIVRSASARALARTGHAALEPLRHLVRGEPNGRGPWAAFALGEMGLAAAPALPELRAGMRRGMQPLAGWCAIAVAQVGGDAEALPWLEAILQSDEPDAPRRAAASALGQLGPAARRAAALLEGLLDDDDIDLQQAAEAALAQIRRQPQ